MDQLRFSLSLLPEEVLVKVLSHSVRKFVDVLTWSLVSKSWSTLACNDLLYRRCLLQDERFGNSLPERLYYGANYRDYAKCWIASRKQEREFERWRRCKTGNWAWDAPERRDELRVRPFLEDNFQKSAEHGQPRLFDVIDIEDIKTNACELMSFWGLALELVRTQLLSESDSPQSGPNCRWSHNFLNRYKMFLQLRKEVGPNVLLVPSLDIAFCSMCHLLLDSVRYSGDLSRAGSISGVHRVRLSDAEMWCYGEALKATERLWRERYPLSPFVTEESQFSEFEHKYYCATTSGGYLQFLSRPCSYFPKVGEAPSAADVARIHPEVSQISLSAEDLEFGLKWMSDFYENCFSAPFTEFSEAHHASNNEQAIEHLVETYERFLWLARKYPEENLVPGALCRFLWMAHQLDAESYKIWTTTVLGHPLHHAMKDATLVREIAAVGNGLVARWKEEFGVSHLDDQKYQNTTRAVLQAFNDFDEDVDGLGSLLELEEM